MIRLTDIQLRILEKGQIECADVTRLLGDYVDSDLTPTLRARIHTHIESCEQCQVELKAYRQVIELALELRDSTPISNDVKRRLQDRLNEKLGLSLSLR